MTSFPGPSETRPFLLPQLAIKPWITPPEPGFILRNASVVDPARGALLSGRRTIRVERGFVVSVEKDDGTEVKGGEREHGLIEVDLKGAFVCPGLIDCHVHVTATPGAPTMQEISRTPPELVSLRSTYVLKGMLLRGFTTVRDTGGASKSLAVSIDEGLIVGPRLFQCGKALSQTGGHGDFTPGLSGQQPGGCCGGHSELLGRTVDGVPEVLRAVREELKAGADFIKVMIGGGVASETDSIDSVQYSPEEVQAITRSAWAMGKRIVTAHAYTSEAINHALDNGVKAIEHGNLASRETLQRMADEGVFLTPTLSCYGIMVRKPFEGFLSEESQIKNKEVMRLGLQALKIADEVGVTVCYGTDLLTSMHALQTEEFTVRSEVLDSPTILRQATTNAAKLLNRVDKIGTLAAGSFADLIVLNENPLLDVRVLDRPEKHLLAVMKQGKVYSSLVQGLVVS